MKCAMSVQLELALELQSCSSTESQKPFQQLASRERFRCLAKQEQRGGVRAIKPLTEAL
jgi:hypothetical protein